MRPTSPSFAVPGTPAKSLPSPGSVPLYRVREGGEMVLEIAQRTLGSGDRWTEIYRLNPTIFPREVIPGGRQLQLPGDARIDPQDRP